MHLQVMSAVVGCREGRGRRFSKGSQRCLWLRVKGCSTPAAVTHTFAAR